jgi:hypothetical protein
MLASAPVRRRTLVEFTGPPGAGKSALAAHVAERLSARGLRVPARAAVRDLHLRHGLVGRLAGAQLGREDVAGQRLEYFKEVETPWLLRSFRWRHPLGWRRCQAALAALRRADPDEADTVSRWIEQSVLTYAMLRAQARRIDAFLWEEGIAHRAVNLFVRPGASVDLAAVRGFLRRWAFPDALVHVDADLDACVARLAARGGTDRLAGRSPAEVRTFVESAAEVAREITVEARRRGIPTFDFENRYPSLEALLASPACAALADELVRALRAAPRSAA